VASLHIVGIAGSLRNDSYSHAVLNTLSDMLDSNVHFTTLDIGAFPHYNLDLENQHLPDIVIESRAQVARANALFITVPEYNHGIPGVLKNALDWLSRPVHLSCMLNKPVFFASQSTGALGGVRAQYQLRETLSAMLCQLVPLPEIAISQIGDKISYGRLNHSETCQFIRQQLATFMSVINTQQGLAQRHLI
jgi:chromate reductase